MKDDDTIMEDQIKVAQNLSMPLNIDCISKYDSHTAIQY